jgi:hypothetical protein
MLAAVSAGIRKANRRANGEFDGLHGSLPEGTARLLDGILGYLRSYLLDERELSETRLRALLAESLNIQGKQFQSTSRELADEGVRIAIGILCTVWSALKIDNGTGTLGSGRRDAADVRAILLSGIFGLTGAKVRRGGSKGAATVHGSMVDRERRRSAMQTAMDRAARDHPRLKYRALALLVGAKLGCHERTIRKYTTNPVSLQETKK